jgi:hypothetical protein
MHWPITSTGEAKDLMTHLPNVRGRASFVALLHRASSLCSVGAILLYAPTACMRQQQQALRSRISVRTWQCSIHLCLPLKFRSASTGSTPLRSIISSVRSAMPSSFCCSRNFTRNSSSSCISVCCTSTKIACRFAVGCFRAAKNWCLVMFLGQRRSIAPRNIPAWRQFEFRLDVFGFLIHRDPRRGRVYFHLRVCVACQ